MRCASLSAYGSAALQCVVDIEQLRGTWCCFKNKAPQDPFGQAAISLACCIASYLLSASSSRAPCWGSQQSVQLSYCGRFDKPGQMSLTNLLNGLWTDSVACACACGVAVDERGPTADELNAAYDHFLLSPNEDSRRLLCYTLIQHFLLLSASFRISLIFTEQTDGLAFYVCYGVFFRRWLFWLFHWAD